MDLDELEPRKKKIEPRNLEVMGVKELEAYINELETEIARVRAAIAGKSSCVSEGAKDEQKLTTHVIEDKC